MSDPARQGRGAAVLGAAVLLALVLVVFGRSVSFEFLSYDDRFHIHENRMLHEPGIARASYFWARAHGNLYVPLAYNLFAAEAAIADRGASAAPRERFNPAVFHATSIGLHAICCLLVYGIALRLGAGVMASVIGAGLFAVHPLQVESVAWISEQRGLLSGALALGSALVYIGARDRNSKFVSRTAYAAASALFVLSMLAKPSSAPLPAAILIVDVLVLKRDVRGAMLRLVPWCAGALAMLLLTRLLQSAESARWTSPLWLRPLIAGDSAAFYLWKLVWPLGLSPDHARPPRWVAGGWWIYAAWIVPTIVLAATVFGKRWKTCAAAICFFVLMAPTLGLVSFHHQNISTVADRYAYLSLAAPALLAAGAVQFFRMKTVTAAGAVIVIALAARSTDQLGHWRSDEILWAHTLRVQPRSATAHNNLGYALYERGEVGAALDHYLAAIEIDAGLERVRANAGSALEDLGREEDAEAMYRAGMEHHPSDVRSLVNLGAILARRGEHVEARTLLDRAIAIAPDDADALTNLGMIALARGSTEEARVRFERAIQVNPNLAEAHHNLGIVHEASGRRVEAIACWERAIAIRPLLAESHYRLGNALLAQGDLDGAEARLREVLWLQPQNARAMNNLGLTLVQRGDLLGAEAMFARAVECDGDLKEARENLESARKLQTRQSGQEQK